jgi:hypothetical protein
MLCACCIAVCVSGAGQLNVLEGCCAETEPWHAVASLLLSLLLLLQ